MILELSATHTRLIHVKAWGERSIWRVETAFCVQGDYSGRLQPPVDLVPTFLAAIGPLLQLPTAQVD